MGHQGLPPVSCMRGRVGRVGLHGPGKLIGQPLQIPYYVPGTRGLGGKTGSFPSWPELLEGEMDMICNLNNHKNSESCRRAYCVPGYLYI